MINNELCFLVSNRGVTVHVRSFKIHIMCNLHVCIHFFFLSVDYYI